MGARARVSVGSWVRACRGVGASDHVLAGESCLSRDESASRKRIRHTLFPSVHPSEPSVGMRSCPAFRGGEPPKVRRNPRRTDPVLVFAAVMKMAPSSREATGPQVPNECFFQRGVGFSQGESHAGVCT